METAELYRNLEEILAGNVTEVTLPSTNADRFEHFYLQGNSYIGGDGWFTLNLQSMHNVIIACYDMGEQVLINRPATLKEREDMDWRAKEYNGYDTFAKMANDIFDLSYDDDYWYEICVTLRK